MKSLALVLLLVLTGCAHSITRHGIPNLGKVDEGIYRGGQPTAQGWTWLKSVGVTNVIKLNTDKEGSDYGAVKLGMTVHRHPITPWKCFIGGVSVRVINNAVGDIKQGSFIHCTQGSDRTGIVVATYRLRDGWPKRIAEYEMFYFGFHRLLQPGLWERWELTEPVTEMPL